MKVRMLKSGEIRNVSPAKAWDLVNAKLAEPVARKITDQAETR